MLGRSLLSLGRHAALARATRSYTSSSSLSAIQTTFNLPDPAIKERPMPLTKIVATIGPTSEQYEPLLSVSSAGMRIMRLNFSHATVEEVELRCGNLIKAQQALTPKGLGLQETRAILLDTKGPEIRSGKLAHDDSGHETVTLEAGSKVTLHNNPAMKEAGTATDLYIDYKSLHRCLSPGMKVLLDDGAVILTVDAVSDNGTNGTLSCTVENTGDLRSRAGVNLPLADTSDLPAMSDKDKADIKYGMTMDIDFVAASFVQTAAGVEEIRAHIAQCAKELGWAPDTPLPLIISKIETAGSLKHFDAILEASDGIMVARGDLGVEIPLQQVTNAQKEMVAACNAAGKPVVVATQMLESMSKSPRPTRAEVADVTNAVADGADCVMLSGETAKGKFPTTVVKFMNEIIVATEEYAASKGIGHPQPHAFLASPKTPDSAIARAAVAASKERHCRAILVMTNHGTLPKLVAAYRPNLPIITFCPSSKIARQLQLYKGVHPIVLEEFDPVAAVNSAKTMGYLRNGDEVVVVGVEDDSAMGRTATMKIATVP